MPTPIASRGIKLKYGTSAPASTVLYSLISTPDMGGAPEMIDVTTLADSRRVGLPGVAGNDALEFGGLMGLYGATGTTDEYAALRALDPETAYYWELEWPDGSKDTWQGYPSVRANAAEVNAALGYTLSIIPSTDFTFTPAA
jgi:hypothetical protein